MCIRDRSLEWLARHRDTLEKKVYQVPDEIDDQIGRVKLAAMGLAIDQLTPVSYTHLRRHRQRHR